MTVVSPTAKRARVPSGVSSLASLNNSASYVVSTYPLTRLSFCCAPPLHFLMRS